MGRTVLIDGDIVAYRAGFACEHKQYYCTIDGVEVVFASKTDLNKYVKDNESAEVEWESNLTVEPLPFALSTVKRMLNNIQAATKATHREVYLTGAGNFRDQIATIKKYKGNRDEMRRPMHHEHIIEYMVDYQNAIRVDGVEADDMLATRQLDSIAKGEDTVIASIDKDLLQIPGKHYNFQTEAKLNVSPETARKTKYVQMLTGDGTDNIPGIWGVGPKVAEKMLAEVKPENYRKAVLKAWSKYLSNEETKPDWLMAYHPETGDLVYRDKDGEERESTLENIVTEIEGLISVGVPSGKAD